MSSLAVLKELFLATPVPLALLDSSGKFITVNREFEQRCEVNNEDMLGREISDVFDVEPGFSETELSKAKLVIGSRAEVSVKVQKLSASDEGFILLSILDAVSGDPKRGETLEKLGTMASGIAHDLNNLLTGVLGHVSYLRLALPTEGDHCESLAAIEDGAKRAASMTQQILDFMKASEKETRSVNFSLLASAAVNVFRGGLDKNIEIVTKSDEKDVYVEGNESRLNQLVMNLVVNARDAMSQGGVIRVSLQRVILDADFCDQYDNLEPGEFARLSVIDSGEGIPDDLKDKIFERYFTTKKETGTGMGLAIVCSIVAEHQGHIECYSEIGKGTRFDVYMPSCDHEVEQSESSSSTVPQLPRGDERILVVDDEEVVRTVIERSLEHLGYRVDSASGGREALAKYESQGGFDLVVLDMMMPDMTGDEVFEWLKKYQSDVRVLLASGYSSEGRAEAVLSGGGKGFLKKPFAVEELAYMVREALDS